MEVFSKNADSEAQVGVLIFKLNLTIDENQGNNGYHDFYKKPDVSFPIDAFAHGLKETKKDEVNLILSP